MDEKTANAIKQDFLTWSGGFTPCCDHEISIYIDAVGPVGTDEEEVRQLLRTWMETGDDADSPEG